MTKSAIEDNITVHDAFGMVSFSRWTSGSAHAFVGSKIRHDRGITLRVQEAEQHLNLNREWWFPTKTIVELNLSEAQFAELITSLNAGSGVPCTLQHYTKNGKFIKASEPVFEAEADKISGEVKADLAEIDQKLSEALASVDAILKQPSIRKKDMEHIREALRVAASVMSSSVPFAVDQFIRALEQAVTSAKADIEQFAQHRASALGLVSSDLPQPKLIEKK